MLDAGGRYTFPKQLFQNYTFRARALLFYQSKVVPPVKCSGWMKIVNKTNFEDGTPPGGEFIIKRKVLFVHGTYQPLEKYWLAVNKSSNNQKHKLGHF